MHSPQPTHRSAAFAPTLAMFFLALAFLARGHAEPVISSGDAPVITIDDLLGRQSLSELSFSPDGGSIVMQVQEGYSEQPRTELFAPWMNGQHLFVADPKTNSRHTLQASGETLGILFARMNPWSADGEALLLTAAEAGNHHVAYWDRRADQVHVLPGRPRSVTAPGVVWAGRKLVYTSLADDQAQMWSRTQKLDFLARQWRQAWTKEGVAPTVSSENEVFTTSQPSPGALYFCDTRTGRSEVIARGSFGYLTVSADGRWVAVARQAEIITQALSDDGRRGELLIFDLSKDQPRLAVTVTNMDVHPAYGAWAPGFAKLLFGAKEVGENREAVRLFQLDASTGEITAISAAGLQIALPFSGALPRLMPFGWMGEHPVAIAGATVASAAPTQADGYGREANLRFDLYVFGAAGATNLTGTAKAGVRNFIRDYRGDALAVVDGALWRINEAGHRVIFTPEPGCRLTGFSPPGRDERYMRDFTYYAAGGEERVAVQLAKNEAPAKYVVLDLARSRIQMEPVSEVVSFSPDLLHVITQEADRWAESYVYDGHADHPVATVNQAMNAKAIAPVHPFTYRAAGAVQKGWYITPPHADPAKSQPAVVWIYGGHIETARPPSQAATIGSIESLSSGQLLAAAGYVVIYASYPLQPGKKSNLMADLATQAVSAIDQLAADHVVDPARVAIAGHSFGGFSTAAVLTQRSDRFRAGIASAGIYDPIGVYGAQWVGDLITPDGRFNSASVNMDETGQLGLGAPPWRDPDSYMRNSPFFHVETLDTPLLILQGDLDGSGTSLDGAARFYEALVQAGKHPTLIRYWAEAHVPVSGATMRYRWQAVSTWLAHYLQEPANASFGARR
ncbi:MAG: hypothetical protein JWM35_1203 [Verrucomicrobia bacterium]|nr:hypothetical protein [Verrucomicrobiota bacterium]